MPPSAPGPSKSELAALPSSFGADAWWKRAVVYQVWPASFNDSNGDGIGDVRGIIEKVEYIKHLGADVVWSSPLYDSPDRDMGYDVADYKKISPRYGTLEDVDELIAELKKRDMKFMMDLVVNHTSDQHAWFLESRSSPTAAKRDWYIWRKGKVSETGEKLPPNNWTAFFTGPAWTYDEPSDEWYLSIFSPYQPDLNWENPAVREAVYDIMRFWLDRGVAGFRMDVINEISKVYDADGNLPDAPITEPDSLYQPAHTMFCDGPRVHEFIQVMHREVLSKYDTITVGETPHAKHPDILLPWTHPARNELRTCFTFDLHDEDGDQQWPLIPKAIDLPHFKGIVNKWHTYVHASSAFLANYLCNHDQPRSISRWASDAPQFRRHAGRMLALFQCSLSGTLYCYQGQDIGMKNIPKDWGIEEYLDCATINFNQMCKDLTAAGKPAPAKPEDILSFAQRKARDNARTPVQWTSGPQAGFTTGKPWMRVQEDDAAAGWNAAAQLSDPHSVHAMWRSALAGRKAHNLHIANFNLLAPHDRRVFAYVRNPPQGNAVLVVLNWSAEEVAGFTLPADAAQQAQDDEGVQFKSAGPIASLHDLEKRARFVLGSHEDANTRTTWKGQTLGTLRPYEGVWFELQG